jgi:hypothetical protein
VDAVLLDLATTPAPDLVGAKAARLGWLMANGWPVPAGVVAPFAVSTRLAAADDDAGAAVRAWLRDYLVPGQRYVVRSSGPGG